MLYRAVSRTRISRCTILSRAELQETNSNSKKNWAHIVLNNIETKISHSHVFQIQLVTPTLNVFVLQGKTFFSNTKNCPFLVCRYMLYIVYRYGASGTSYNVPYGVSCKKTTTVISFFFYYYILIIDSKRESMYRR